MATIINEVLLGRPSTAEVPAQNETSIGGADRDRTDDLLNAIIPNLSRASYSWKKYPAFLTVRVSSFSGFSKSYPEDSDKIRTATTLYLRVK